MKNKKIMIVALCMVIAFAGLLYYANVVKVSGKESFEQDGYVHSNQLENEGENKGPAQFYFRANSIYEKRWPSKVLFHDTQSEKIVLEMQSYLHYTNGDMGAFADGVLVNLGALEQTPITYYRMKAGAILKKVGTTYQMQHVGKTIAMHTALWKLSETKYVVVSSEIKIHLGEHSSKDVKGYVEIEIQDKGIVSFRNQNVSYQTVVEGSKLELADGMFVDFNKKGILKQNKEIFSLTQMVVDSNANIEIVPEENKSIPSKEKSHSNPTSPIEEPNNAITPNDGGNTQRSDGNAGTKEEAKSVPDVHFEDTTIPKIPDQTPKEDTQEDEQRVTKTIPSIALTSLKASIVGVELEALIHDDDDVLTSAGVHVKLFEKANNKLVYHTNIAKGVQKITEDIQNLKTNTDYILSISGTYVTNGVEYTNDFLNKQFRTEMLDLNYKINEKTSTSLSYKVFVDKGTKITGATVTLFTADKTENQKLRLSKEDMGKAAQDGHLVEFQSLQANTTYYTKMTDVVYDNSMTIREYDTFKANKTLKTTPTLAKPTIAIDKRNGTIGLYPGKISDPDIGIQNYRYEIVDAADTSKVIYSSQRDVIGSIEVSVDGIQLQRKENYFWRLVAVFHDNDKGIEVASFESDMFSLDINNLPTLAFTTTTIQHDAIEGTIHINDSDKVILRGDYMDSKGQRQTSSIKVYATDPFSQTIPIGGAASTDVPTNWDGTMDIQIHIPGGLKANETETFKIYADVNLGETLVTGRSADEYNRNQYYLGELRVTTANTVPMRIHTEKNASVEPAILNQKFVLNTRLSSETTEKEAQTQYIASTLHTINYAIYKGRIPANATDIQNARAQLVVSGSINAVEGTAQKHQISIKSDLFDQEGRIQANDIEYDWKKLTTQEATIVFREGKDYVGNTISLGEITNRVFTFQVNGGRPELPKKDDDAVDVQVIRNVQLAPGTDWTVLGTAPKPNLDNATIVGLRFAPRLNNSAGTVSSIRYKIKDQATNSEVWQEEKTYTPENTTIARIVVPIEAGIDGAGTDKLRRGHQYTIRYEVDLDLNYDGSTETVLTNRAGGVEFTSTRIDVPRQAATFKTKFTYDPTPKQVNLQYYLKDVDASYVGVQEGEGKGNIAANVAIKPEKQAERTETMQLQRSTGEDNWASSQLTNVSPGTVIIKTAIRSFAEAGQQTISNQRIYPQFDEVATMFKAETKIENNELVVTLKKAEGKKDEDVRKAFLYIAAGQISVADKEDAIKKVTSDHLRLESIDEKHVEARMRMPLTALRALINKKLVVSTKLHYVNGKATTKWEELTSTDAKLYAVELVQPSATTPTYVYDNKATALIQQTSTKYPANGSVFRITPKGNVLNFENQINKNITIYNAEYTGFPLKISMGTNLIQNVMLKELAEATITTDSTTVETGFNAISGTISIHNANGNLDSIRGIDRIQLSYSVDMENATNAKENKVYFEVYERKKDSTDFETTPKKTYEAKLTKGKQKILLDGLSIGQTYKLKEYVKVSVTGTEGATKDQNQYLFDIHKKVVGADVVFTTTNTVVVSNMKAILEHTKDTAGGAVKKMKLSYHVDQIGFTKIEYVIKKWNDETKTYGTEVLKETDTNSDSFKNNMTRQTTIGKKTTELQLGVKYQVQIRIFSTKNPYKVEAETQVSADASSTLAFQLAPLRTPIVAIQLVPSKDDTKNKITATINVDDADYAATDKQYSVQLLNKQGKDITPEHEKKKKYSYAAKNQSVVFVNAEKTSIAEDEEYTVKVVTNVDLYANGTASEHTAQAIVTTLNSFDVALGDMEIVKTATRGKADLQFYGAVNLSNVKKISYTLYQMSNGTSVSIKDETFAVTLQAYNQYWKHTIEGFTTSGKYSVQVQFLSANNEVIGTLSKNFVYT